MFQQLLILPVLLLLPRQLRPMGQGNPRRNDGGGGRETGHSQHGAGASAVAVAAAVGLAYFHLI